MTSRRRFFYGVIAAQLASRIRASASSGNTGSNPTSMENQNAGTPNWQIGLPGFQRSDDFTLHINGYASATSINRGAAITFYVTVNPTPQTYNIDIYRVGWYGGAGGQLKFQAAGLTGISQPAPAYDPATGTVTCPWTPSYAL